MLRMMFYSKQDTEVSYFTSNQATMTKTVKIETLAHLHKWASVSILSDGLQITKKINK